MVALKEAPLKTKEKSRSPVALGRRKEFNIQIHQLIDAMVLVLSLWLAYALRYELAELFKSISPLESANVYVWLLRWLFLSGRFCSNCRDSMTTHCKKQYSHLLGRLAWLCCGWRY